ncbi:MAG TPA: hypothetical protein ENI23_11735 [bacterium]|nr:hypothetical protein [bacterium]
MTVRQILKKWLEENGYDGLYSDECTCTNDDLISCELSFFDDCKPGYKIADGHGLHIGDL